MLSWPCIVTISKILVKDYPVVVDKEERFRGKTFCKFEHITPGHKTLTSEWFLGFSTLWEGLHYGQGRKCDSQLPRPPSRWSHPSGEPVIIIFVIMIIIIFRIIIVICSAPSSTLSWITSCKSSFYRPPRLFLLLDSPSFGSSPSWFDLSVKVLNCEGDSISDCLHELLSKHVLDPVWIVRPCRNTKIIASCY